MLEIIIVAALLLWFIYAFRYMKKNGVCSSACMECPMRNTCFKSLKKNRQSRDII
ncbi:MAG: FeoB-associated Cys-rich membrane protein [Eubacteriales bacterium]|nr:FeoB-associated Cys-rich membrane protein [Eubacteriales bacterium]